MAAFLLRADTDCRDGKCRNDRSRKLYLQHYNSHAETHRRRCIIKFEDKYSEEVQRKCVVGVQLDGTVSVSIKPQSKEYHLDIWTASIEQLESIVYDFMELNIETS